MRLIHIAVTLLSLVMVFVCAASLYAVSYLNAPNDVTEDRLVEVPTGWGMNRLAMHLEEIGQIDSALALKLAARLSGQTDQLKSGEYLIKANSSVIEIMDQLTNGVAHQRQITIPEGTTSFEIVQLLNKNEKLVGEPIYKIPDEGSLLPETYNFTKGETRQDIIVRMQAAQNKLLDALWSTRADNLPIKTKGEALVLASIIEKETGIGGERRKVSGVFVNRLRKGMLLQTDPTVIYALTMGKHKNDGKGPLGRRLLRKDLKIDSPYNTYRYKGLPPTPIANPGALAIEAALNPEEHGYYYFVADGTGGHAFGRTLEEHNRNVAAWRKIRKTINQ